MRFAICKGETRDGGRESGIAKPTTDGAGGRELEVEEGPASQDANVLFRTGGADSGIGTSVGVGVGVGVGPVHEISLVSGSMGGVTVSCRLLPPIGRDNAAVEGMSCNAAATPPGGDAPVGAGLM
jgi:hypothetical protein